MRDWVVRWQVRRCLVVVAGAGVTFVVVFFAGQWLLPRLVDWALVWVGAGWAVSGLTRLRDDSAWALAGLAATGVMSAGLFRRSVPTGPGSDVSGRRDGRVLFGEIPHRAWSFQERPELMARVSRPLDGGSAAALVALVGMAGAGKSQLAAQVARGCVVAGYGLVAWINAESGVVAGLARLGREGLGLGDGGVPPERVAAMVREEVERADGVGRLLVFDNVEDPGQLLRYLPAAGSTRVLVTTNRPEVATLPGFVTVPVGVFAAERGRRFLADATGLPDGLDAGRLGERMGWLPLGLAQAAAYIVAEHHQSYRQYLDLLAGVRLDDALRVGAGAEHPGVLRATELSIAALRRDDPTGQANRLLVVLCLLSSDGVSRALLTGPAATATFAPVGGRWWRVWRRGGEFHAGRTLSVLANRCVVTISAADTGGAVDRTVVTVHRLIATVVRYHAGLDGSLPAAITDATRLLGRLTDDLPTDQVAHRRAEVDELVGHIESVRAHATPPAPLLLIQRNWAGRALMEAGDLVRAVDILHATLNDRVRVLGVDHPHTLASRSNLASAYRSAGRVDEAIDLYERVLADSVRVLGVDHPHTLASRNNLAYAYRSAGRVDEAIDLYEKLLADCERVLSAGHPLTQTVRGNLDAARGERGDE